MFRKLAVMMAMAMVIAIAGIAYNRGIAAADEPVPPPPISEDELADFRESVYENGGDGEALLVVGSDGSAAGAASATASNITVNPWGCRIRAERPHQAHGNPGRGHIRGKATIICSTLPPAGHVATISQELSRWAGSTHTIMAVNYSVCPSGQGDPDCFSNRLDDGALMRGYVTTPRHCQIGKRYNWVHIAVATLTVEGVTYSGLDGDNATIRCRDMRN